MNFNCPDCGKPLEPVRQSPGSPLNVDQFDAVKAGDFFCSTCPGNGRGNSNFRYFWKSELPSPPIRYECPPTAIQALKAVLVFHAGGPFDETEWTMLTGDADATTKGLCDMIRGVLERER